MNYQLTLVNNTATFGTFCLYQGGSGTMASSLAWFTKNAAPTSQITLTWGIDYSFVWGETGVLEPGVVFNATQTWPADLTTQNIVTLTMVNQTVTFTDLRSGGQAGTLSIAAGSSIPPGMLSVGTGMSGRATLATQVSPNMQYIFQPHPHYYVAFGDFQAGQVLDPATMTNAFEVVFPPNIFSMTVTLNADGTWTAHPNALPMTDAPPPQAQL